MSGATQRPANGGAVSPVPLGFDEVGHPGRGPRALARQTALDVSFEADVRDVPAAQGLEQRAWLGEPVDPYALDLIQGVSARRVDLDGRISAVAENWAIDRMPIVDRNILRIAVYELLVHPEVPPAVVLSEAVRLATLLSTDRSGSFVNGVLARILRELQAAEVQGPERQVRELQGPELQGPDLRGVEPDNADPHPEEVGEQRGAVDGVHEARQDRGASAEETES